MNFSGVSSQTVLGKFLRLPLKLIPSEAKVPILQGRSRGMKWIVGSSSHGCWLGSYEYDKRHAFENVVKEGDVVFDIGAHVGFYTLLASALVGPRGKVFAFEPVPRNLFYLREHLRMNHITNVTVIEAAVSSSSGQTFFDEGLTDQMGRISTQGRLQVNTVCLEDLVSRGELPCPDHMKIDVEGGEMSVFLGARSVLAKAHPTVFLATHGRAQHQQCCEFLRSLQYQLQAIGARSVESCTEILAYRER